MDILDKLVAMAQLSGSVNVQCQFQGDWFVRHEAKREQGLIHIVTSGSGYLKIDGETQTCQLKAGDVVLFPRTAGHILSSETACQNSQNSVQIREENGLIIKKSGASERADFSLFCARFAYDSQSELLRSLPETIFLSINDQSLSHVIALLQIETAERKQGLMTIVDALFSVLITLLIRNYLSENTENTPLFGALNGYRDRRLRTVVQAVTDAPEKDWRVDELADVAKMSRAQLMRLFRQQMQTSPHAFVNAMRLQKAALLLRTRQDAVLVIALETGFQSETHFGKAFKKHYGCTPGQYRKSSKQSIEYEMEYMI